MVYSLKNEFCHLTADYENSLIAATLPDGKTWRMKLEPYVIFEDGKRLAFPAPSRVSGCEAAASEDIYAEYGPFEGSKMRVFTRVSLEKATGDLRFEVRAEGDEPGEIRFVAYPSPWSAASDDAFCTVLPRMQGELIPKESRLSFKECKIFERTAYMPMYGQVSDQSAYLAVYDTPYDASYSYESGELQPLWRASLGTMRYQRRMLYRFVRGDYNDIAKAYRAYVKEKGALVTLRAKAALNPIVERLPGCPIIHTGITVHISPDSRYYVPGDAEHNDHFVSFDERARQIRRLRDLGLRKAYTHFDGWGVRGYDNLHPSPLPPSPVAGGTEGMIRLMNAVKECGYLFGIHDQYRDYYYDAPGFTWDEARQNLDGSHSHNHTWHGGWYAYLCAAKAVEYVRRNYIELARMGIHPDSSYLDVFSLAELDECFNPRHLMTREESVRYRRECLDILSARGIIPSSEETLDCILPSQVLCHHAPFYAEDLKNPADALGIPLFNLVYHDCVVIPWNGLPGEQGASGLPEPVNTYLYAILNADPVYCPIDADAVKIGQVERACAVAERLAYTEMLRHEFMDGSALRQRVRYADGMVIEVDMEKGAWKAQTAAEP